MQERESTTGSTIKSTYGKHVRGTITTGTGSGTVAPPIKTTEILVDAQEIRFVPRIYTTDYSPVIKATQEVAVKY